MPKYQITASNGSIYELEAASDEQAKGLEGFINERVAAGDTQLTGAKAPFGARIDNNPAADRELRGERFRGKPDAGDLFNSGLTFGLMDEIAGVGGVVENAVEAPFRDSVDFDPAGAYTTARDAERIRIDKARQNSGALGTLAELGAGFVGVNPVSTGRAGLSLLQSIGQAAKGGAAFGAVGGFGSGEGATDSLVRAGLGAVGGAAIGSAIPVAGGLAANRATGLSRMLGRDTGGLARQIVGEQLERDAITPAMAGQRLADAAERQTPLALADVGENTRGLLASVSRQPGGSRTIARDFVEQRQAEQGERVVGAIGRDLGRVDYVPRVSDELTAGARRAARPLYEEAYAAPVEMNAEIAAILETPAGRGALGKAVTIARNEGRDPTALGFDVSDGGDPLLTQVPSVETLDLVKRGLDDLVEDFRDPVTRRLNLNSMGRSINDVRSRLLAEADRQVPAYGQARAAFAGPAGQRDALELGRASLNASADDIERMTEPLSEAEQQQFALGFRAAMADNLGRATDGADRVGRLLGTPRKRAALQRAFGGEEGFGRFMATMADERATSQTYRSVMTGSQTAERLAADAQTGDMGLVETATNSALRSARSGGVTGVLADALQSLGEIGRFGAGKAGDQTRESVAALLTETDPTLLREIARAVRRAGALQKVQRRNVNRVGASVGRQAGRAVTTQAQGMTETR